MPAEARDTHSVLEPDVAQAHGAHDTQHQTQVLNSDSLRHEELIAAYAFAPREVHEHTRWRGGRGATVMVALAI